MNSQFDPATFIETTTDAVMETEYTPIPEATYLGVILHEENHPLAVRSISNEDTGRVSHVLDVNIRLDAPGNDLADGKIARYSCWLDITPEGGFEVGPNKNVRLGLLRDAVGQNVPGQAWGIKMLAGQPLMVSIKHSPGKDGRIFSNVDSVAKAA